MYQFIRSIVIHNINMVSKLVVLNSVAYHSKLPILFFHLFSLFVRFMVHGPLFVVASCDYCTQLLGIAHVARHNTRTYNI